MVGAAENAASKNGGGVIRRRVGRPRTDLSRVLDALFYRLRNPGPWRDLPKEFGPWKTIHHWVTVWSKNGLWVRILRLICNRRPGSVRLVDGSHVPVHQSGANPRRARGPQQTGKTRGGRNTKIMALTDADGRAVALSIIPGQAYEGHHVEDLLENQCRTVLIGDKGFDDDKLRGRLNSNGHIPLFPSRKNRKHTKLIPKRLYRIRYRIENFFCRLKRFGSVAIRREKLASHFSVLLHFAAIIDHLKSPVG